MDSSTYRGRLANGEAVELHVRDERITSLTSLPPDSSLPWLFTPLVDLQHNGALGMYYHNLPTVDAPAALNAIARHLRRHGVGRCMLTFATAPFDQLIEAARQVGLALDADPDLARLFPGIFHEGLYMSRLEGWRGAHPLPYLRPPDYAELRQVDAASGGRIRMVNIAPELEGGMDFIHDAIADGKAVTLGHCRPDRDIVDRAIAAGARWVTHFGNGAATTIHRFDNPFWIFLDRPELTMGIICDGFHLPREIVSVAMRCKGRANCIPVSDASGYAGCPPGIYTDSTYRDFVIEPNGHLHLADSEILMGAWFQLDRAVEFLVQQLDFSLPEAWDQCSRVPAEAAGLSLPELAPGGEASFVIARWESDRLLIEQSIDRGRPLLEAPIRTNESSPSIRALPHRELA